MSAEDYYPAGAYNDPRAPYNETEIPEREFDVCISQTLSKSTSVNTSDYTIESNYLDADEGGGYVDEIITSETNWNRAYSKEHYTPLELIGLLKRIYEDELKVLHGKTVVKYYTERQLKNIIDECSNWVEDDVEVYKE